MKSEINSELLLTLIESNKCEKVQFKIDNQLQVTGLDNQRHARFEINCLCTQGVLSNDEKMFEIDASSLKSITPSKTSAVNLMLLNNKLTINGKEVAFEKVSKKGSQVDHSRVELDKLQAMFDKLSQDSQHFVFKTSS